MIHIFSRLGAIAVLSLSCISFTAGAFPLPSPQTVPLKLPMHFSTDFDFEGIISLSNCSGSLIQLESGRDSDPALVLTNGHCIGSFPEPGEYFYRESSSRTMVVLDSAGDRAGRLNATELIYATMTGTDMALYRMRETYAEIKARFGVRPFVLASREPEINQPIEVVSGYWRRGYRCSVEAVVYKLREGGYEMDGSLRYTRPGCEVIGGTSGSPVIAQGTRTVIAVNNTGNESGGRCHMNNPCEVDRDGNVKYEQGLSYAQQTYRVYSCLNRDNELDLSAPGCLLFSGVRQYIPKAFQHAKDIRLSLYDKLGL
ncbi:MAG: serine protease [Bdellovibrionales bacterium]